MNILIHCSNPHTHTRFHMQFQDKVSTATTSDGHFSFCQETSPQIFFPSTLSFSFCLGRYTFYESVQQFRSSLTSSLCKNSAHQLQFCHVKLFGTNTHTHARTDCSWLFCKNKENFCCFSPLFPGNKELQQSPPTVPPAQARFKSQHSTSLWLQVHSKLLKL